MCLQDESPLLNGGGGGGGGWPKSAARIYQFNYDTENCNVILLYAYYMGRRSNVYQRGQRQTELNQNKMKKMIFRS